MRLRLYENYRFVLYAPFYAAHAIGSCTDSGLTVELLPSPGVGLAEQALLDGTVEVIWAGPAPVAGRATRHSSRPGSGWTATPNRYCAWSGRFIRRSNGSTPAPRQSWRRRFRPFSPALDIGVLTRALARYLTQG